MDHHLWGGRRDRAVAAWGLFDSDSMLHAIGAAVADRYRVVAFDRRGHGRTADTDDASHYDDMVTETVAVLEALVGGPAHLVGWSDGGIIACCSHSGKGTW